MVSQEHPNCWFGSVQFLTRVVQKFSVFNKNETLSKEVICSGAVTHMTSPTNTCIDEACTCGKERMRHRERDALRVLKSECVREKEAGERMRQRERGALPRSLSFFLFYSFGVSLSHTHTSYNLFWMGEGVLRVMSQSVELLVSLH